MLFPSEQLINSLMSSHPWITADKDILKKQQYGNPLDIPAQSSPISSASPCVEEAVCSCTVHLKCPLQEAKLEMQMCPAAGPQRHLFSCNAVLSSEEAVGGESA